MTAILSVDGIPVALKSHSYAPGTDAGHDYASTPKTLTLTESIVLPFGIRVT